uniref:Uncharacterized protein n=1 Tax=Anopheles atroparvus TaxID=41427 RepID=A0A182IPV2_ANOAO
MSHKPEPTVLASVGATRILTLLVAVCLFGSGIALNCQVCHSTGNYQECLRNATATCTVSMVNTTHLFLAPSNPTLRNVTLPKGKPQFQCFQVNYTGAAGKAWNYEMGCTFASTKICEGWRKAIKCHTGTAKLPSVTVRTVPVRPTPVPPATSQGLQVVIVPGNTYGVQQATPPPPVARPAVIVVHGKYKSSAGSELY